MKTRWILAVALLLAQLLAGCAPGEGVIALKPGGSDDTAAIQAAFDQAVATPGSTIKFAAGDYYLSKPIVANNLSGTVRGAGSEKTVIHLVPGVAFGVAPGPAYPGSQLATLFLLTYDRDGAELTWEGMGWDIEGHAETWNYTLFTQYNDFLGVSATGMSAIWLQGVGFVWPAVNTTWRDIRMQGREDPEASHKANTYPQIFELLSGTHTLTDCHYDTMAAGVAFLQSRTAAVQIGGDGSVDQVTARNVRAGVLDASGSGSQFEISNLRVWRENALFTAERASAAVELMWHSGEQVHISGLEAENISGVWLFNDTGVSEPSTIVLEGSDILMDPIGNTAGIEIHEPAATKSQFTFTNNRIEGINAISPLVYTRNTVGATLSNNAFAGSGRIGLWLGALKGEDSEMLVQDNDLEGWTTADGGKPPIWLGNRTSGITVSGCGDPRVVVQDDTDDPATPAYDGENIIEGL